MLVPPRELDGVLLVDKPLGPHLPRRRRPPARQAADEADRPRRDARPDGDRAAGRPGRQGDAAVAVPDQRRQGVRGDDRARQGHRFPGCRGQGDGDAARAGRSPRTSSRPRSRASSATSTRSRPMYSAIKIDGVPLYKKARKGEEVEREPRFIRVMGWELTRFGLPRFDFRLRCTKGTYVRTLAHDLGQKLGCGAYLAALRRTASGPLHRRAGPDARPDRGPHRCPRSRSASFPRTPSPRRVFSEPWTGSSSSTRSRPRRGCRPPAAPGDRHVRRGAPGATGP